jgi:pyruvate,water dikinase
MITPDMYVVEKSDMSIAEINISEQEMMIVRSAKGTAEVKVKAAIGGKQKLAGKKIIELAKICAQIEKHYGFPCDIEWAMEKNKLYITQSRPITTL